MPSPTPDLKPEITSRFGGYDVTWPAPACLSIAVRRVHVHTAGRVTGELEISRNNGSGSKILLPSSEFNFSASRTRSSLAKEMTERCADAGVDWLTVIEKLANDVQQRARTGEDAIETWGDIDSPPPKRLLNPIIFEGVQNIIFGEKGVNKSTLALIIASCLVVPWYDNPLGWYISTEKPLVSLYLDWETDQSVFNHYRACLRRGMDIPAAQIYYRYCALPLADDIEAISKQIDKTGAKMLIIDSLGAAAGTDKSEGIKGADAANRFNTIMRQLNLTTLILGQTSKSQEGKKTIYGSTYFTYYARNIFELCRSDDDSDTVHLALFHRECNFAKKAKPLGLCVSYENDHEYNTVSIKMQTEDLKVAEFSEKVTTGQRIIELLKSGPLSQKELVQTLDISFPSCSMAVKRLLSKKQILKLDDGKIGLLSKLT